MAITTRAGLIQNIAKGQGVWNLDILSAAASVTAAAAASGFFTAQQRFNSIGSTLPGTIQQLVLPPSPPQDPMIAVSGMGSSAGARALWIAHFYKLGTLNLAATGDQFTHDAATFPITRTQFGATAQPLTLIPLVRITTATTTTAAVFRLRTAAGGSGYTDQDGNSVVGAKTMTLPAAATAANSCYVFRLEDGDSGVRDIAAIEVTTAAAAGDADVWGVELIAPVPQFVSGWATACDSVFGPFGMQLMNSGAATGGSLTSHLGVLDLATGTTVTSLVMMGPTNT